MSHVPYGWADSQPMMATYMPTQDTAYSHTQYAAVATSFPWTPGFWKSLPWSGLAALLGAALSTVAMVGIVIGANGKAVSGWEVQPSVYLAIASAVANILIHCALTEGLTVAWWVRSLRSDKKLVDMHNAWAYGTSFWSALLAGRRTNVIAIAGLLVAISPINAPLLQRAVVVTRAPVNTATDLTILAAQEFPQGYTGVITGRAHLPALTTANFSSITRDYMARKPLNVSGMGCSGTCKAVVNAAGYAMDCIQSTTPFNVNSSTISQYGFSSPQASNAINGTNVFTSNFTYYEYMGNSLTPSLNFTAVYKQTGGCDGNLQVSQCTLKPAIMAYHVVITNNSIALDNDYDYTDDQLKQYTPAKGILSQGPSTHGGLALVLNLQYQSTAHLRFTGAVGYETNVTGYPAIQFSDHGLADVQDCDGVWTDPTTTMLGTARELAFRVAITAANASNATNVQQVHGTRVDDVAIYSSRYAYLAASLLVTLLAGFGVFPLFLGWWRLGRSVSLSPLEIAKAFDAPHLSGATANGTARQMLREVGETPVMYGRYGAGTEKETVRMDMPGSSQRLS